jgi:uncharacterized membrane protein YfcA
MTFSFLSPFTPVQLALCVLSAIFIGMSKGGLKGIAMLAIPFLVYVFGAKASTGIMVILLLIADFTATIIYRKTIMWNYLLRLFPPALAGIGIGLLMGSYMSDFWFKLVIGVILLFCAILMIYKETGGKNLNLDNWYFATFMGIIGGFATMIGNAAGPIMATYFLAMGLNKNYYVGTESWFFFLTNMLKLLLQIFVWKNVSTEDVTLSIGLIPFILIGSFMGYQFVKFIPEKGYRIFIISVILLSTIMMFLR